MGVAVGAGVAVAVGSGIGVFVGLETGVARATSEGAGVGTRAAPGVAVGTGSVADESKDRPGGGDACAVKADMGDGLTVALPQATDQRTAKSRATAPSLVGMRHLAWMQLHARLQCGRS